MASLLQLQFIHMDASWGTWRLRTHSLHARMADLLADWLPLRSHAVYQHELLGAAVEQLERACGELRDHPAARPQELAAVAAGMAQAREELAARGVLLDPLAAGRARDAERTASRAAEREARHGAAARHDIGALDDDVDGTPSRAGPRELPSFQLRSEPRPASHLVERDVARVSAGAHRFAAALNDRVDGTPSLAGPRELLPSFLRSEPRLASPIVDSTIDRDGAVLRTTAGDVLLVRPHLGLVHMDIQLAQQVERNATIPAEPWLGMATPQVYLQERRRRLAAARLEVRLTDLACDSGLLLWRTGREMEGIERYVEMAHRLSALPPSGAAAALSSDSPAMELSSTEEAEEAAAAAVELAIEERLERRTEREARHVLFDDLQRGWSDTTFGAERLRLEALDEDDAQTQHEPEVIGVEDRADGLVLADL
jgi:hypothetical protein